MMVSYNEIISEHIFLFTSGGPYQVVAVMHYCVVYHTPISKMTKKK